MRKLFLSFFLALLLPLLLVHPAYAEQPSVFKVLKVVDGDTLVVDVRGKKETVRLLGMDAPETVDPRKPVQCFGKAASDKMKSLVQGKDVILIDDSTQGNRDSYKRLLRFVYLPDSKRTFINGEMIKEGYAFSYRQYPTKMLSKFNALEKTAREKSLGLWGSCPVNASTQQIIVTKPQLPTIQHKQPVKQAPLQSGATSIGGDKDCADFATHTQAQTYFTNKGGGPSNNVDRLDNDHDGIACENLP